MKKSQPNKWKGAAILAFGAWLAAASSASAQLTITGNSQLGPWPFTPSWAVAPGSMISGLAPASSVGDFSEYTGGNVANFTVPGNALTINNNGDPGTINMQMCGNDSVAGRNVSYTLPASTYGQNITNITVYGGWAGSGRDNQDYAILYSTVDNPTNFYLLTTVHYAPDNPGVDGFPWGQAAATQVAVTDLLGGNIATNVAAVKFDFGAQVGENGAAGYTAIAVYGTPATVPLTPPNLTIAGTTQTGELPLTPSWTVETPSLIAGMSPSSSGGDFTGGGYAQPNSVLTDGNVGTYDNAWFTLTGCGSGAGHTLIYTLTNSVNGSDVTNIVVYNGSGNNGRNGQYYILSYATVTAPTTFIPITTVFYNPDWAGSSWATPVANRVAINNANGAALVKNVAAVKFDFANPPNANMFEYGWSFYGEIVVQGADSLPTAVPPSPYLVQDTLPNYSETVVGNKAVFKAAFSNSPPVNLQWQSIIGGVTNIINTGIVNMTSNGVIFSTLTLNNVQLTNSGYYQVRGDNATNGAAAPSYSTASQFVVNNLPTAINNVLVEGSCQLGAVPLTPTWTLDSGSLISGLAPSSLLGDFGEYTGGNVNNLTDPSNPLSIIPYASANNLQMCGNDGAGGRNVIYTLPASTYGQNITNITVYGGWQDGGRDGLDFAILYSTPADPTRFFFLTTAHYNPLNPNGAGSATRVAVVGASSAPIATNVAALKFDFAAQTGENGAAGYTAIAVYGTPATRPFTPPNLTITGTTETGAVPFTPDYTVPTDSLIAGMLPSTAIGDFSGGGYTQGPSVLTDGNPGVYDNALFTLTACGSGAGQTLVYTLTNSVNGSDVTNIVVYNGWGSNGRNGQYYILSYSTVSAPGTFIPITTVFYNPDWTGGAVATRVAINNANGAALATNVAAVKFDFASPPNANMFEFGWSGYGEIVVEGVNSAAPTVPTAPAFAKPSISGGKLILTGTGGTPNAGYTWLTTTNLSAPINWTTNLTGNLDGSGNFSNSIPIGSGPAAFFRFRMP